MWRRGRIIPIWLQLQLADWLVNRPDMEGDGVPVLLTAKLYTPMAGLDQRDYDAGPMATATMLLVPSELEMLTL
jgi:hypothetical protein